MDDPPKKLSINHSSYITLFSYSMFVNKPVIHNIDVLWTMKVNSNNKEIINLFYFTLITSHCKTFQNSGEFRNKLISDYVKCILIIYWKKYNF